MPLVHYPDLFREEFDLAVVVSKHGIGRIKLCLQRSDYDDQGFLVEGISCSGESSAMKSSFVLLNKS